MPHSHTLADYGWTQELAARAAADAPAGSVPARVLLVYNHFVTVVTPEGICLAKLPGRLRLAPDPAQLPTVGDYVLLRAPARAAEMPQLHSVLPRRTLLTRKAPGTTRATQPLAANVDTVLIVTSCNEDYSLPRIQRFLTIVHEAGAEPVIVLNKTDLVPDSAPFVDALRDAHPNVAVLPMCALMATGLDALRLRLAPGMTLALFGSSGVGKTTLVNRLEPLDADPDAAPRATQPVAPTGRGRHTTTHRELLRLACGALLIDTPGIRELQLHEQEEGLHQTFDDIMDLAAKCRFTDCRHEGEPGCAVREAVDRGELAPERFANYGKLRDQIAASERPRTPRTRQETRRAERVANRALNAHLRRKRPR